MNGEMFQLCMLVNAARNAIIKKKDFTYLCDEYVSSVKFNFITKKTFFRENTYTAGNPHEWFRHCVREGVREMKFLTPLEVKDRFLLGFSNVNRSCIVAFHLNHQITYWTATWEFEQSKQKWNIVYQEYEWENPPDKLLQFENNTQAFKDVLLKIGEFADRIEFKGFGDIFRNANDILSGKREIPQKYPNGRQIHLPDISEEKKRTFYAASIADVFGAMGSWNDSPAYYAHENGLDEDYENLSNKLLRQIRLAVLYAINED